MATDPNARLIAHYEALKATFPLKVQGALDLIPPTSAVFPLQLLALTRYVRFESKLDDMWAWTKAEEVAYLRKNGAVLRTEIDKVKDAFRAANPGYALSVNSDLVRNLDDQATGFGTEANVLIARGLHGHCLRKIADEEAYPEMPTDPSVKAFHVLLERAHTISDLRVGEVSRAAPGLSKHGRARAVDFEIRDKSGTLIADARVATIKKVWETPDAQGSTWKAKLKAATKDTRFVGPLEGGRPEPWHYEFK